MNGGLSMKEALKRIGGEVEDGESNNNAWQRVSSKVHRLNFRFLLRVTDLLGFSIVNSVNQF